MKHHQFEEERVIDFNREMKTVLVMTVKLNRGPLYFSQPSLNDCS